MKFLYNLDSFSCITFAQTFDPPDPLVRPYLFYMYPSPYVLVSYPLLPLKKKLRNVYEFSNEKSVNKMREENYYFVNVT